MRTNWCLAILVLASVAAAEDVKVLCDFETEADVKQWQYVAGTPRLVTESVTHGKNALEITFDPKAQYNGAYVYWKRPPRDWTAYDALVLDVFNPSPDPVPASLLVADQAWRDKNGSYWNRHNCHITLAPGSTQWTIPVRGLYRGEAGSRNNDIKRNIDPDSIVRVDFGFGRKGTPGRILIDNLRFVKAAKPEGVWAFDFGPPSQPVMLGWTPVTYNTAYTKAKGYGWGPRGGTPWNGSARDTTFGGMLLQDFCASREFNFQVDVPDGKYRVTVFYENAGYWGGEQAKHNERRILANGKVAWNEPRPDGSAHALYRFEDVEPVGVDIWDTYMAAELAKPVVFEADAKRWGLSLRFECDTVWGSKIAAVAVHAVDDADAAAWLDAQLKKVADEFRAKAVCLDPKVAEPPHHDHWRWNWPVRLEDDITPGSLPTKDVQVKGYAADEPVTVHAVRGETETICLAVRALKQPLEARFGAEWTKAPSDLPMKLHLAWYNTSRGFGQIAYHIKPHTLRACPQPLKIAKGVTRLLVLKVQIPENAPAGEYQGVLFARPAWGRASGSRTPYLPFRLVVHPVTLDRETDYLMAFFGLMPSGLIPVEKKWDVLDETLRLLREYGMNAVCGGPNWTLKGWQDGQPIIDYGELDQYFALLKKHGFTKALGGYGGLRFRGLHDGYEKGAAGAKVEQQSGLPYEEAVMRAWGAFHKTARAKGWPPIFYAMCDETRVRDKAERELVFMKIMDKVYKAFPDTIIPSGSYSVNFQKQVTNKDDLLYWHQRFFENLAVSSLNGHDPSVMAEAEKLGRDVHIYNQGRTRYSFGLYQWSEYRKGVKARWQWHLNVLHGYQFFDLDGREPDTAMICYGRDRIYPTIHFERCREGAEDFYLYNTLWKLIEKKAKAGADVSAARALLDGITNSVALNQRTPPDGYDPDALKLKLITAIEELSGK